MRGHGEEVALGRRLRGGLGAGSLLGWLGPRTRCRWAGGLLIGLACRSGAPVITSLAVTWGGTLAEGTVLVGTLEGQGQGVVLRNTEASDGCPWMLWMHLRRAMKGEGA